MEFEAYLWAKWVHYAAFISWMAMLFYQPRLFVYHAEHLQNHGFCDVVKIQESKLYHGIGWLAMIATIASGVVIIVWAKPDLMAAGYFHIKLLCGVILVAYHLSLGHFMGQFARGECRRSGQFFRAYNEVPTLVMFVILWAMLIYANGVFSWWPMAILAAVIILTLISLRFTRHKNA